MSEKSLSTGGFSPPPVMALVSLIKHIFQISPSHPTLFTPWIDGSGLGNITFSKNRKTIRKKGRKNHSIVSRSRIQYQPSHTTYIYHMQRLIIIFSANRPIEWKCLRSSFYCVLELFFWVEFGGHIRLIDA